MQENINIPDSNITTNLSFRQLVLMNMQQLTNFPYIEKDFDALTDYELLCLVVKFLNDVISNQNEQNNSITRMYESFLALQDYVNNTKDEVEDAFNNLDNYVRTYFENLDVQEEINNKLDQMLENGTLQEIIDSFLQLYALICFDNVQSMTSSPNLVNGSYAKTLGYYEKNDGGAAFYKIRTKTNEDIVDNGSIIEISDTLVAELCVGRCITVKQFGAKGDNETDDTVPIQHALAYKGNDYTKVIFNANNTYLAQGYIDVYSNTDIILKDATIKDCHTGTDVGHHNGLCFRSAAINANTTGYGATKNISITGGTLDGGTAGLMFGLLHVENIHFEDIYFYNCFVGTHIMDLCGCKNISIKKCQFEGNLITDASSNYREMIQPDYANQSSGSYWGTITGYDDLPTKDLIVENCSFKKGEGTYYPNAIGTHTSLELPHENITIRNCEFYGCTVASIRLPLVNNVLIENNTFYDLSPTRSDLNTFAVDFYMLTTDYTTNSKNITISNNKFLLDNELNGNLNCIRVVSSSSDIIIKNIKILGNYSSSNFTTGSTGGDFLQVSYCDNIILDNNTCYKNKHFLHKFIGTSTVNSIIVTNNNLQYLREYITNSGNYSSDTICNIEESNNIWTDSRGTVNLNKARFVLPLTSDIAAGSSNARINIVYTSTSSFITIDNNGTIYVPNIFRNIKVYAYTGVATTSAKTDSESILRVLNRDPDIDKFVYSYANLVTSKTIDYPIMYLDGVSDKMASNGYSIQHQKWLTTSETIKANETKTIHTQLIIETF